jgi:hypothetical protein
MQSTIAEKGIVAIVYRCNVCPDGCELRDNGCNLKAAMHQHACHRFPSVTTAWKRVA